MPSEPRCSICTNPTARTAVAELRAKHVPFRDIASRLRLSKSSIARHCKHAEIAKKPGCIGERKSSAASSHAGHVRSSRCSVCGQLVGDSEDTLDAKSIIRRAERILFVAEAIAAQAQGDDDPRTVLLAVDRCQRSIETLARIAGILHGSDGPTVDARAVNVFTGKSVGELEAILAGLRMLGAGDSTGLDVTDNQNKSAPVPALPAATGDLV
jgi:hypothetical protein